MKFVYPQGLAKALTFSYDDGQEYDRKLVKIFNQYGFKGTFHLNSGTLDGTTDQEEYIKKSEVKSLYEGHEVACHSVHHYNMTALSSTLVTAELVDDRRCLEELTGDQVFGFSYPFGIYNDELIEISKNVGLKYSRTVNSNGGYFPPADFLQWHPTCHHSDNLIKRGEDFLHIPSFFELPLMYVWGHSFEFGRAHDWSVIEEFGELMSNKDDIWYATNIEIYEYLTAIRRLDYSADCKIIKNTSSISVWFLDNQGTLTELKAGEKIHL